MMSQIKGKRLITIWNNHILRLLSWKHIISLPIVVLITNYKIILQIYKTISEYINIFYQYTFLEEPMYSTMTS